MKRINITLFALMLLGILFSCTKASLNYTQNGNWVSRAVFPQSPSGFGSSFVIAGRAYIGMGQNPLTPLQKLSTFYQYTPDAIPNTPQGYDSASGKWRQVSSFPGQPRSNATAFALANGKGYVGTGVANDGVTPLDDFWSYDPNADHWDSVAPLIINGQSYARWDAVGWGFDSVGYVLTGADQNYTYGNVFKYDPVANAWSQAPFLPGNTRSGAIGWVYKGKGYIVTGTTPGGRNQINQMAYDFWRFDPTIDWNDTLHPGWKQLNNISNTNPSTFDDGYANIVRKWGTGFVILGTSNGDKGYVTLGSNGSSLTFTWEYDFASDLWTEKTPFEGTARSGAQGFSIISADGRTSRGFVVAGQVPGSNTAFQDLLEFLPNQIYNQFD